MKLRIPIKTLSLAILLNALAFEVFADCADSLSESASARPDIFSLLADPELQRKYRANPEDLKRFRDMRYIEINQSVPHPGAADTIGKIIENSLLHHEFEAWTSLTPTSTNLSFEELFLMGEYSETFANYFNSSLRENNPDWVQQNEVALRILISAANKAPRFRGRTYRLIDSNPRTEGLFETFVEGSIYSDPAFMSSSPLLTDMVKGGRVFPKAFLLEIHTDSGADVSEFVDNDEDREILIPPGTKFLVHSISTQTLSFSNNLLSVSIPVVRLVEIRTENLTSEGKRTKTPKPPGTINFQTSTTASKVFPEDYIPSRDSIENAESEMKISETFELYFKLMPEAEYEAWAEAVVRARLLDRDLNPDTKVFEIFDRKVSILKEAGFNNTQIQSLFEQGLIGRLFIAVEDQQATTLSVDSKQTPALDVSSHFRPETPLQNERSFRSHWFVDEQGSRWLLKSDRGSYEQQTGAEVATAKIYEALGYPVPETKIVYYKGIRYVASKELENTFGQTNLDGVTSDEFGALYYFAAFLKDWDRLEIGSDEQANNFDLGDGAFALIDFGGSLGSRALGESKPSLDAKTSPHSIGGFESTADSVVILQGYDPSNLSASHPWNSLRPEEMQLALNRFRNLSNEEIALAVAAAQYTDPEASDYLIQALINRRNGMIAYLRSEIRARSGQ